jgi:hypothetical protein
VAKRNKKKALIICIMLGLHENYSFRIDPTLLANAHISSKQVFTSVKVI